MLSIFNTPRRPPFEPNGGLTKKCLALILFLSSTTSIAAPFEIKVHDEQIAAEGEWAGSVEAHLYQSGANQPTRGNVFQTMLEMSYGITSYGEIGFHAFVSRHGNTDYFNGGKVSYQVIPKHDEAGLWHYGLKIEAEYLRDFDRTNKTTYEITPILAAQFTRLRVTVNPSIDFSNAGSRGAKFLPGAKLTYPISEDRRIGAEWYSEMGPLRQFVPASERYRASYLTLDNKMGKSSLNFAIGKGSTNVSERWLMRVVYDRPF